MTCFEQVTDALCTGFDKATIRSLISILYESVSDGKALKNIGQEDGVQYFLMNCFVIVSDKFFHSK